MSDSRDHRRRKLRGEHLESRRLLAVGTFAGTGVLAQYFSDPDLGSLEISRTESNLALDWGAAAPDAALNPDSFSVRLTGRLEAEFTEEHTFTLNADGGARLWVNGIKQIDSWTLPSVAGATANINLISGRQYDIQLEFRETGGDANVDLVWSSASLAAESIPTKNLFPSERGSIGRRVWNGIAGSEIANLTSITDYPDTPSAIESLSSLEVGATTSDQFGDRISGLLHPPQTGSYEFFIAGDDSAELWLSNSDDPGQLQQIAATTSATSSQDWTATPQQRSGLIDLVAGQSYAIEILRKEDVGADHVAVGWLHVELSGIEVIDGEHLSPSVPIVSVYSRRPNAVEGDANPLEFEVVRTGPTTNALDVTYVVSGTSTSIDDYTAVSGSVTIPANASSATVQIAPTTDSIVEGAETVLVEIVDEPGYQVGFRSERQSTGIIQDIAPEISGGVLISPTMTLANYQSFGGTFTDVTPTAPYSNVIEATVGVVTNPFSAQLRAGYTAAVEAGDILWADAFVRSTGGSQGRITAIAERSGSPFTSSLSQAIDVPETWTRLQFPFVSAESYAPGEASFGFFLGHQPQTLQFADIRVLGYGPPSDLTPNQFGLNNIGGSFGNFSTVQITGQTFDTATQITTQTEPPNNEAWRLQYGGRNSAVVKSGNDLQLTFWARSISGPLPRINVVIQNTDNFSVLMSNTIQPTPTWQQHTFNLTLPLAGPDYAIDGLQAMLNVGFAPQAVEVADIAWTNLSAAGNLADFPSLSPSISYEGRASDEPWRDLADDRIDEQRKAELTVNVVDGNGSPVNGAVVSIRQTSHDFLFGSAASAFNNLLSPNSGVVSDRYQSEFTRLFNAVTIENSLKWPTYLQDVQRGQDAAAWAVANDLYLRGHNIIWPSRDVMPTAVWDQYDSLLSLEGTAVAENYLQTEVESRIQDAVTTFKDQVIEWDVVNEPFDNNDVMNVLGNPIVTDWFTQVRTWDADAIRVLNDYDIFTRNGGNTAHRTNFEFWLTQLSTAGVIEKIGAQGHYRDGNLTDIGVLGQLIESYDTQFGLPIAVTEFDIRTGDRQLQADYLRDYATMLFSQDAIDQFILWGFWAGARQHPEAALLNDDFSVRPHGQVYEDLVFGSWWTDQRGTSRGGQVVADVFKGDYEITVSIGDQVYETTLSDFAADGAMNISLPGIVWSQSQINGAEGTSSTVTAALSEAPTSDVTIMLLAGAQLDVSPAQLTFTPNNWDTPQLITIASLEDYVVEGSQTEYVSALTTSLDERFNTAPSTPVEVQIADGTPPLTVASVSIADTQQRSVISEVAIEFDGLATIQPNAFTITRVLDPVSGDQDVELIVMPQDDSSGSTIVTLQFTGDLATSSGALIDGNYRLTIDASKITLLGTTAMLDGNADGSPDGNHIYGGTLADDFYALFADNDGDGMVTFLDFIEFRRTYGLDSESPVFNSAYDIDGNGAITFSPDFIEFRRNYGKSR
ncbi:MAG: endo-1,4-beta-xylanase [Rubripirellula sp.]